MTACEICNKRLSLSAAIAGHCRCEGVFCALHAPSNLHSCKFDYRMMEHARLETKLVRCIAEKVEKI